jgi:hypothetical protein
MNGNQFRLAFPRKERYSTRMADQTSNTLAFLDEVETSMRATLDALVIPSDEPITITTPNWNPSLVQLESNLNGWQALLEEMAVKVQETQTELTALDADLKRSLDTFTTARKHLQGTADLG